MTDLLWSNRNAVMKKEKNSPARLIAERIADELFNDGSERTIRRMIVEYEVGIGQQPRLGGGYCKESIIDLVERVLKS